MTWEDNLFCCLDVLHETHDKVFNVCLQPSSTQKLRHIPGRVHATRWSPARRDYHALPDHILWDPIIPSFQKTDPAPQAQAAQNAHLRPASPYTQYEARPPDERPSRPRPYRPRTCR